MATKITAQSAELTVAEKAAADVAAAKTGRDWTRPVRYTAAFVSGTVRGTLNGFAQWGNKGLKFGALAGLGLGIMTGGLPMLGLAGIGVLTSVVVAGIGTFFAAAAAGAAVGLLTGGMNEVGRIHRGEKYAEDLIDRSKLQRAAPQNTSDYRRRGKQGARQDAVSLFLMERRKEAERDSNTYWQDREHTNPLGGRGIF